MKAYIVGLYENVDAQQSFVDESGAIYDCIPVEQQPALRGSVRERAHGSGFATPRERTLPRREAAADEDERIDTAGLALRPERTDWHGNVMHCPEGTIPMRRVTLRKWPGSRRCRVYSKGPAGGGRPPRR